jgi:hypothetical protein
MGAVVSLGSTSDLHSVMERERVFQLWWMYVNIFAVEGAP